MGDDGPIRRWILFVVTAISVAASLLGAFLVTETGSWAFYQGGIAVVLAAGIPTAISQAAILRLAGRALLVRFVGISVASTILPWVLVWQTLRLADSRLTITIPNEETEAWLIGAISGMVIGLLPGTSVGLGQWMALRGRVEGKTWMTVSIAGWSIGVALFAGWVFWAISQINFIFA